MRDIRESIVPINYRNTSILDTPFTFGIEWEPSICMYYSPVDLRTHYDREEIFTTNKKHLKLTIEENKVREHFPDVSHDQESSSCKYNQEIAIGILGKNPVLLFGNFLQNSQYFIPEIKDELNEFKDFFEKEKRKEYFREIYKNPKDKIYPESFINCEATEPLTPLNNTISPYFYVKEDIDVNTIQGRPQITLGLSYALFPPLLNVFKSTRRDFILDLPIDLYKSMTPYNFIDINNKLVCDGFALLVLYYSTTSASYFSKKINPAGHSYFKGAFELKPRSNLAESYKHLRAEYSEFSSFIDLFKKNVNELLEESFGESFEPSKIDSYNSLVNLHLNVVRKIAADDTHIIERINQKEEEYKNNNTNTNVYQDIVGFITTTNYDYEKGIRIFKIVSLINTIYLIHKIFNPQKVVKLKINREKIKIKRDCKFLDGYYYSYEGESKELVDELVTKNIAEIINNTVYDFSHTSDPQILEVDRKEIEGTINSICPSDREELFEYIPEDSNLIIEVRTPEKILGRKEPVIEFKDIEKYLSQIFTRINIIFRSFLKQQDIELPRIFTPSISYTPSTQQFPMYSSLYSKIYNAVTSSCSVMFRPNAK